MNLFLGFREKKKKNDKIEKISDKLDLQTRLPLLYIDATGDT